MPCSEKCPLLGRNWPPNKGKPLCRLETDYEGATNPVTKASIRQAIESRRTRSEAVKCLQETDYEHR